MTNLQTVIKIHELEDVERTLRQQWVAELDDEKARSINRQRRQNAQEVKKLYDELALRNSRSLVTVNW